MEIKAVGTISITADVDEDKKNVNLSDVFYVPDVHENLMSVAKITHKNLEVIFKKDRAVVVDHSGNVKLRANRIDNLYYLSERERAECYKVSDDVLMHRRIWRCGIDLDTYNALDIVNGERNKAMRGLNLGKCDVKLECEI